MIFIYQVLIWRGCLKLRRSPLLFTIHQHFLNFLLFALCEISKILSMRKIYQAEYSINGRMVYHFPILRSNIFFQIVTNYRGDLDAPWITLFLGSRHRSRKFISTLGDITGVCSKRKKEELVWRQWYLGVMSYRGPYFDYYSLTSACIRTSLHHLMHACPGPRLPLYKPG